MRLQRLIACLLIASGAAHLSARQGTPPRQVFVEALGAFGLALDGTYGDERTTIQSALGTMRDALDRWERLIRTYESAMAAEVRTAPPELAARMNAALASAYLERHRVDDARPLLIAARNLDPARAEVHALLGALYDRQPADRALAVVAFEQASRLDPANPIHAYVLSRHLAKAGKADEAARARRVVLADNVIRVALRDRAPITAPFFRLELVPEAEDVEPFFPPVRYQTGFAAISRGDYPNALAEFGRAAARDPLAADTGPHRLAIERGAKALRDGALDVAIDELAAAADAAPARAEPRRLLGRAYVLDGQIDAAVRILEDVIRLDGSDERARLALADTLIETGRLDEALERLQATLAVLPSSGRARYRLARLHQRRGDYAAALREFDAAIALGPLLGLNGIYETMGRLQAAQQDFEAAAAAYSARVDVHPNDPDAHADLGDIYLRQGRHEEALAEFIIALLLDPAHVPAAAAMAQAYAQTSELARAADAARRVLELDAAHTEARYVLATSLIRAGRTEEGNRHLDVFQEQQAAAAAARARSLEIERFRREASVSAAQGGRANAVELLRKVLELEPSSTSHLELGLALLDDGRPGDALQHLNAAAALNAPVEVHRYLAAAYDALGQPERSRQARATYDRLRRDALRMPTGGR